MPAACDFPAKIFAGGRHDVEHQIKSQLKYTPRAGGVDVCNGLKLSAVAKRLRILARDKVPGTAMETNSVLKGRRKWLRSGALKVHRPSGTKLIWRR
jgi:hypothetical protein